MATAPVFSVFLVACTSISKAALIIAAGAMLARRGVLTSDVRKGMSNMAAGLLVPCLLFDRVSSLVTWSVLRQAWPILPLGGFLVAIGCAFGYAASRVAPLPPKLRRAAIAATAFANSQALPILIIDVIGPESGPMSKATARPDPVNRWEIGRGWPELR